MPGFVIDGGGDANRINRLNASATVESRRKHRWYFSILAGGAGVNGPEQSRVYLQSAQRPHSVTEEAVMHHDEEQAYFAGKYHWEPISLVFYDVTSAGGGNADASSEIYRWLNNCVNIYNAAVSFPSAYKKDSLLVMTLGNGTNSELWYMYHCWPIDINWNDLDYTNTEIQTIDVSMKYDRAERGSTGSPDRFSI